MKERPALSAAGDDLRETGKPAVMTETFAMSTRDDRRGEEGFLCEESQEEGLLRPGACDV